MKDDTARNQLTAVAESYLDTCERDYAEAQKRMDRARRILEHLRSGEAAADCPVPILNESAEPANRYAARVDALLTLVYKQEENE